MHFCDKVVFSQRGFVKDPEIFTSDRHNGIASMQARSKSPMHVLLTNYELLMGKKDRSRLTRIAWQCIVVDEGHRLKNSGCKLNSEMKRYNTTGRLLLTGKKTESNFFNI